MRNPITPKEKNQRRIYTYDKSREYATTLVNMAKRVDIVQRKKETSTVCTARKMDTS